MKVILASDNQHKLTEFRRMFSVYLPEIELIPLRESGFSGEIVEDGDTFESNSFIKADTVCRATGFTCIADDSGLEVDALNGAPGIYSARYSGQHGNDLANIEKLLMELSNVPDEQRTARFVSCICVVKPDGSSLTVRGTCEGKIIHEMRGAGTFGYDPVFLYEPFGKTFAELEGDRKNEISHRGRAMEILMEKRDFFLK